MGGNRELLFSLADYNYSLPEELIAQVPLQGRKSSRLLVLDRVSNRMEHRRFEDLVGFLREGDLLVVNDTRVVPARLLGQKETGGRVELLVLDPYKNPDLAERDGYQCLVKSSKRLRAGAQIALHNGACATLLTPVDQGTAYICFSGAASALQLLAEVGEVPLPPYIQRDKGSSSEDDATAYQTVYALKPGAVAAPTAGLHFSQDLLGELEGNGVAIASITLHVGYGTFAPIRTKDVRYHRMHCEYIEISRESADSIRRAKEGGRHIVAVGTTVVRSLEWVVLKFGKLVPFAGLCDHYIYPGYRFKVVDALITNFHLPKSTLLLLVCAFAGRAEILEAYREAVRQRYRFFSYGDAMLIL